MSISPVIFAFKRTLATNTVRSLRNEFADRIEDAIDQTGIGKDAQWELLSDSTYDGTGVSRLQTAIGPVSQAIDVRADIGNWETRFTLMPCCPLSHFRAEPTRNTQVVSIAQTVLLALDVDVTKLTFNCDDDSPRSFEAGVEVAFVDSFWMVGPLLSPLISPYIRQLSEIPHVDVQKISESIFVTYGRTPIAGANPGRRDDQGQENWSLVDYDDLCTDIRKRVRGQLREERRRTTR